MRADGYEFRRLELTTEELRRTSDLLKVVFPHAAHLTPRYLQWQYADSPDGLALGCNGYAGDDMVGHVASLPMRARLDGEELRGVFLLNAAVHPSHRQRRISRHITEVMFEAAPTLGFSFCLAVGNRHSTLPLLTRFEMVASLDARIGLGRPARRDRALQPSFERVWSAEALNWRLSNPERSYAVQRNEDTVTIIAPSSLPATGAVLYDGPDAWGLSSEAPNPAGPLRLWIGLHPDVDWRCSSFVPIPQRLRPSPLKSRFQRLDRRRPPSRYGAGGVPRHRLRPVLIPASKGSHV